MNGQSSCRSYQAHPFRYGRPGVAIAGVMEVRRLPSMFDSCSLGRKDILRCLSEVRWVGVLARSALLTSFSPEPFSCSQIFGYKGTYEVL